MTLDKRKLISLPTILLAAAVLAKLAWPVMRLISLLILGSASDFSDFMYMFFDMCSSWGRAIFSVETALLAFFVLLAFTKRFTWLWLVSIGWFGITAFHSIGSAFESVVSSIESASAYSTFQSICNIGGGIVHTILYFLTFLAAVLLIFLDLGFTKSKALSPKLRTMLATVAAIIFLALALWNIFDAFLSFLAFVLIPMFDYMFESFKYFFRVLYYLCSYTIPAVISILFPAAVFFHILPLKKKKQPEVAPAESAETSDTVVE